MWSLQEQIDAQEARLMRIEKQLGINNTATEFDTNETFTHNNPF